MNRRGRVFFDGELAGWIEETERGMAFRYTESWATSAERPAIARTLPKQVEAFEWSGPAPFFTGLLPEGWLHRIAIDELKIAADDWLGQLLHLCRDSIGAVHVEPEDG
jgi:serine/threonine-protein kinase HipA